MRLVVGIDPGTGMSSPTGLVIFNPDTKDIFYAKRVQPPHDQMDIRSRLQFISNGVRDCLEELDEDMEITAYVESFVLRGKGGETLARLTGALITSIPSHIKVMKVSNMTVKKAVTGSGKADKEQILAALRSWAYANNNENINTDMWLDRVMKTESWDLSDALAIGIAGDMGHGKDF